MGQVSLKILNQYNLFFSFFNSFVSSGCFGASRERERELFMVESFKRSCSCKFHWILRCLTLVVIRECLDMRFVNDFSNFYLIDYADFECYIYFKYGKIAWEHTRRKGSWTTKIHRWCAINVPVRFPFWHGYWFFPVILNLILGLVWNWTLVKCFKVVKMKSGWIVPWNTCLSIKKCIDYLRWKCKIKYYNLFFHI